MGRARVIASVKSAQALFVAMLVLLTDNWSMLGIAQAQGECGEAYGKCLKAPDLCCSKDFFCGSTSAYCGSGCNPKYGVCGSPTTPPANNTPTPPPVSNVPTTPPANNRPNCGEGIGKCAGQLCCSNFGFCGNGKTVINGTDALFCGRGCQKKYGRCDCQTDDLTCGLHWLTYIVIPLIGAAGGIIAVGALIWKYCWCCKKPSNPLDV